LLPTPSLARCLVLVDSSSELPAPIHFKPLYSLTEKSSGLSIAQGIHDFASNPLEAPELPVLLDEATHTSPTNDVMAQAQVLGVTAEPTSISLDDIRKCNPLTTTSSRSSKL